MPARPSRFVPPLLAVSLAASALPATAARADPGGGLPSFAGAVTSRAYDGRDDDLLTAGLGFAGLRRATPPAVADPARPTPAELRRWAVWAAAGLSGSEAGGLGRLYGPNIGADGRPVPDDGKVAGTEYTATVGTGARSVGFVVQVPVDFDRARPCVVAAPATGLANVYNGVGGAGAWGLHHRCAVALIDDDSLGGPVADRRSVGPDGAPDYNLDGELCAYRLAFPGKAASPEERAWGRRVDQGLDATRRDGDLHGKPALIVHGRDDTRVPANHSSRPYLGLNSRAEHGRSALSYVEITHAHHSDSTAPGYDNRYVPLGFYFQQALDLMWARLTEGRPLPPSQVVRTVPRGGEPGHAPPLTRANVPPLSASPAPGDRIRVRSGAVQVPD